MSLVIIGSILAFLTTEMDDLLSLVVLFSGAKSTKDKVAIVVGKYLGLALMVVGSAFFSVYISKVPSHWLGFLGLIPIGFAVKYIVDFKRKGVGEDSDGARKTAAGLSFLATVGLSFAITLASGGDNIAVYISFFTALNGTAEFVVSAIVFTVMQGAWFALVWLIMNIKSLKDGIADVKHVIIPVLFILLGVYIFLQNGTLSWLFSEVFAKPVAG